MGRRKKGRSLDGWLLIDKPLGVGSTDVVSKARWALQAKKAGHAGTLDPLATGLLVIAFGEATKAVPVASDGMKRYRFTARWGIATASDDGETEAVATSDARPDEAAIRAALPAFIGDIMQVPPQFSAVKVDGERAYDLARDSAEFALKARPLHMASLELIAMPDADHAEFEMICGKGGYVRAIARDLGEALGCHAHVSALRRLSAGPFSIEDAVHFSTLDGFRDAHWSAPILPVAAGLAELPEVRVTPAVAADLRMGREGAAHSAPADIQWGDAAWASCGGEAVAMGVWQGGRLKPNRVFLPPEVEPDPAPESGPEPTREPPATG